MTEHSDLTPKYDAAIQVRVCGHDVSGQQFDEISTAFPSSQGVMLETVHQLQEGSTVEITHMLTNRKETTKIKSLGPKLGVSTLVFLEGASVENFWAKDSAQEQDRRRMERNGHDASPITATNSGALLAMPERGLMQVSKTRIPNLDLFMNALNELVESSLEANLRPTVEQLTNAIPEHVVRAQNSVFANFEEQLQVAVATFGSRLDTRGQEVLARNENILIQKILQLMEEAERFVKSRQNEFSQSLEGTLVAGKGRLSQQVEGMVSEATGKLRDRMQEQSSQLGTQFAEKCHEVAKKNHDILFARAQEVESNVAGRLSAKIEVILNDFSAELGNRVEQAAIAPMAGIQERLGEKANALAELAQQVEREVSMRLQQQADEVAVRFRPELQNLFEQDLTRYTAQLQEQLALTAAAFRQKFMAQIEAELNEKQQTLVRQAQRSMNDLAVQNQKRIAGLLRELAEAIENQPEPPTETADVSVLKATAEQR